MRDLPQDIQHCKDAQSQNSKPGQGGCQTMFFLQQSRSLDLVDRNIVSSLLAIYPITYSALLEVGVQLTIYLIGLG